MQPALSSSQVASYPCCKLVSSDITGTENGGDKRSYGPRGYKTFFVFNSSKLVSSDITKTENSGDKRSYGPRGYKTFFVFNSSEHEFFSAGKYMKIPAILQIY